MKKDELKQTGKYIAYALVFIFLVAMATAGMVTTVQPKDENLQTMTKVGVLKQRMYYDSSDRIQYMCSAAPGETETSGTWQIKRFQYNSDGNINATDFAGGSEDFLYNCSNRTTYSYS